MTNLLQRDFGKRPRQLIPIIVRTNYGEAYFFPDARIRLINAAFPARKIDLISRGILGLRRLRFRRKNFKKNLQLTLRPLGGQIRRQAFSRQPSALPATEISIGSALPKEKQTFGTRCR
jgi:hypothetical protein